MITSPGYLPVPERRASRKASAGIEPTNWSWEPAGRREDVPGGQEGVGSVNGMTATGGSPESGRAGRHDAAATAAGGASDDASSTPAGGESDECRTSHVRISSLSHTADVGFEVEAPALGALFQGAATALARMLVGEMDGELRDEGPRDEESQGEEPEDEQCPSRVDRPAGVEDPGTSGTEASETWSLDRPDLERLMVSWLRELLHRAQSTGRLVARTEVTMTGPASLRARVCWWPRGRQPDYVREIKGITYHGLRVEDRGDGWHARVVLDV